jgi:hypothetical protein
MLSIQMDRVGCNEAEATQPVHLAGCWWLVLVYYETKVLLTGCWWLVFSETKVLLAGG